MPEEDTQEIDTHSIENVALEKVNHELVVKNLLAVTKWSKKLVEGITTEEAVEKLQTYYRTNAEELADCTICGADSDVEHEGACPFCGDVDASAAADEEEEVEEEEPAPPVEAEKPKGRPRVAKTVKKKLSVKKPAEKPGAVKETVAKKPVTAKGKPAETAIEVVDAGESIVLTEQELDAAVARIKGLVVAASQTFWHMGKELSAVSDSRLWNARKDRHGKPKYKDFSSFVEGEFSFTPQWANRAIQVSLAYTEQQVIGIAISTLVAIAKVGDAAARTPLLEAARKGASKSAIAEEIKKSAVGRAEPRPGFRGGKGNTAGAPKVSKAVAGPKTSEQPTIVLTEGKFRVPLLAKGTDKPAKTLAVEPQGVFTAPNGVVLAFKLKKGKDGGLEIHVACKRG